MHLLELRRQDKPELQTLCKQVRLVRDVRSREPLHYVLIAQFGHFPLLILRSEIRNPTK